MRSCFLLVLAAFLSSSQPFVLPKLAASRPLRLVKAGITDQPVGTNLREMPNEENKSLQSAAGAMWLMTGCMLMARGGRYFWQALQSGDTSGRAVSVALALGLVGGWAKGRFVLAKTALRNKRRLQRLSGPRPWQIFAPGFYPLIMLMMAMSIGLKKLFATGFAGGMVTYGGIVTGIGSGLVVSSLAYWFEGSFGKLAEKTDEKDNNV